MKKKKSSMSITWYKLKIKKQTSEYECYIRFKFDSQMQSIKIKAFIYLTDSEGNICVTEKKNKLGYDPRILGSLTVEKNFLKHKRKNNTNSKAKYFEVMKYQGNFNICNLPLIDDYFRNGKALFYQYKNMLYLMDNKKYKIHIEQKKFTIILEVYNYGYISLNLFNKLEEVEKQELIFLKQNEEALCHRYFSNKYQGSVKNKKDGDEIEIIEENKKFNQYGGRICIGGEENENINIEEEKDKKDNDNNYFEQNDDFNEDSDDSSVYDSIYSTHGNSKNNDKLNNNNNKLFINGKDFSNDNPSCNVILNGNQNSSKKRSKSRFFNNNNFNNNSYTNNNNENYNNFFIKLKKNDNNLINYNKTNNFQNQKSSKNSNNNNLNFFEKAKNIVNKYSLQKEVNNLEFNSNQNKKPKNDNTNISIDNNKNFNLLCKRIIEQKKSESLISNDAERKILLCSSGFDNTKYYLELIYKSSLHGDNTISFHNKCDNKKNIIIIILTLDNQKFGFFTSVGLSSDKKIVYDNNAFLFKLSKPEMNCFHIKQSEIAFYANGDYILYLGGEQLVIKDNFLSVASYCGMKMKNYKINNNYQINNGNRNFIIKELEVYNISEI